MTSDESEISGSEDCQHEVESGSTARVNKFRDHQTAEGNTRWEIYTTKSRKDLVGEIADHENLSHIVAAEALMSLGLEFYLSTVQGKPVAEGIKGKQFLASAPEIDANYLPVALRFPEIRSISRIRLKTVKTVKVMDRSLASYSFREKKPILKKADQKPLPEMNQSVDGSTPVTDFPMNKGESLATLFAERVVGTPQLKKES